MSTVILDNTEETSLQPARSLWDMYKPGTAPHAFAARDEAGAREWQDRVRPELAATIGVTALESLESPGLKARKVEEVDKGGYTRIKIVLTTRESCSMPFYLLLPDDAPRPLPVVLALHGHGYGVKDIVGLWETGEERNTPDGYHRDFGVALCRAGFAVAAPEISCFGERQTDFSYLNTTLGQGAPSTCTHSAMLAFHLGISVVGMRVFDGMRLVDYLETRKDLDTSRLGAMGISGGGMHTFFSSCVDTRIKASVISGYYCTFKDSILAMSHCACNFVPGLARFGEMYDLVGLIAPRPLLVESGSHDPIFPRTAVMKSVERAQSVYATFRDAPKVETDYYEGRHRISGNKAYEFLKRQLTHDAAQQTLEPE